METWSETTASCSPGDRAERLAPVLAAAVGTIWLWSWRRSGIPILRFAKAGPVVMFAAGLLPALIIGLGLYAAIFGSFVEPSALGR